MARKGAEEKALGSIKKIFTHYLLRSNAKAFYRFPFQTSKA